MRFRKIAARYRECFFLIHYIDICFQLLFLSIADFNTAEKYHLSAIKYRIKTLGEDHPLVGASYNNIGLLYQQKEEHIKSLDYFTKGLEIKKKTKAPSISIIRSISNAANANNALERYAVAHELLNEAMEIILKENVMYTTLDARALIFNTRGKVYLKEGRLREARDSFAESVRISEDTLPKSFLFMKRLASLGKVQEKLGNYKESHRTLKKALDLEESSIRDLPHNEIVSECLECLMKIYHHTGDHAKYIDTLYKLETECLRLERVCFNLANRKRLEDVHRILCDVKERLSDLQSETERQCIYRRA